MPLTRRQFSSLVLGATIAPGVLRAQDATAEQPTLIELFTSQGCSSCPPADALMLDLTKDRSVIPLTYSVEIWDYLGWRDTLAKPLFTKRQRAYAAMVAGKRVYTPQAIVQGRAACVGSDLSAINKLRRPTGPSFAKFEVGAGPNRPVTIAATGLPSGVRLMLLPVIDRQTVPIGKGENGGRTITYAHVVRDIIDLGPIENGTRQVTIRQAELAASGADGFALLAQGGSLEQPGEVFGATYIGPKS